MPGTTPNFGIRYPFITETVTPADFQNFADDIDAALDSLDVLRTDALNRPLAKVTQAGNPTQTPAASTPTAIIFATMLIDTDGMWNPGTPDRLTIQTAGVYMLYVRCGNSSTNPTIDQNAIAIGKNGVGIYNSRYNTETMTLPSNGVAIGLDLCAPGDFIQLIYTWFGAGTNTPNNCEIAALLICRT